jgi:hypothetical protein
MGLGYAYDRNRDAHPTNTPEFYFHYTYWCWENIQSVLKENKFYLMDIYGRRDKLVYIENQQIIDNLIKYVADQNSILEQEQ